MGIFSRLADAIFRMATSADNKRRWLYTALAAFLFGCFLALFFIGAYFTDRWLNLTPVVYQPWNIILGLILLVPGVSMMSWTYIQFFKARGTPVPINPPLKLITTGLYAYSRNPMLMGIFLVFFGVGVLTGSPSLTLLYSPLLVLFFYFQITRVEEIEMEMKFGQAYREYKHRVPRFFPGLSRSR
ncbi:MAG: isoprenylcysteine carboxylmethyltransferase family protein [Dehalococcoidia bacterium]|nr:isoprenylcysteine carboxylmethyltransferase family protein [Dehalococcoidia bacterium]